MWDLILLGNQMLPLRVASLQHPPGSLWLLGEKKILLQVNNLQVLIF